MRTIRFGIIGCGMMGREFASVAARWFHLPEMSVVFGTKACARFSTKNINTLEILEYIGGEQRRQKIDMGHEVSFKSITHSIFQFGVSDAILQMWAGFLHEFDRGEPLTRFSGCVTPEETTLWHHLFTAALKSRKSGTTVALE